MRLSLLEAGRPGSSHVFRVRNGPAGGRVNRRTFETVVLIVVLMQPVLGLVRLWAHKAVATTQPGSFTHTVAEDTILTVQR